MSRVPPTFSGPLVTGFRACLEVGGKTALSILCGEVWAKSRTSDRLFQTRMAQQYCQPDVLFGFQCFDNVRRRLNLVEWVHPDET
jgi:hypothetical protein